MENATRLPGLPLHMSEPKSDDSLSSGASSLATAAPVGAAGAAASAFAPAAFGAPAFGPTASSGSEAASVMSEAAEPPQLRSPGGTAIALPEGVPAALAQMIGTESGCRALQAAARQMLLSKPLLQHPDAPCHGLLNQLAHMAVPVAPAPEPEPAAPPPPPPRWGQSSASMAGRAMQRDESREALEVLSSQFSTGRAA